MSRSFEIFDKFRNKILELFPEKKELRVYHYTSSEILWEFMKPGGDFRCTFYSALSDPTEFYTGMSAETRFWRKLHKELNVDFTMPLYDVSSAAESVPWIMSFSAARDETSLWRDYTSRTGGYAMGFNVENITKAIIEDSHLEHDKWVLINFLPCIYYGCDDMHKINELIKYALTELTFEFAAFLSRGSEKDRDENERLARTYLWLLLASVIKHKDFRDEQEWRLIVQPLELKSAGRKCEMVGGKIRIASGLCGTRRRLINFIDEIIVSPHGPSDSLRLMAEMFVSLSGFGGDGESRIVASVSPYRGEAK